MDLTSSKSAGLQQLGSLKARAQTRTYPSLSETYMKSYPISNPVYSNDLDAFPFIITIRLILIQQVPFGFDSSLHTPHETLRLPPLRILPFT